VSLLREERARIDVIDRNRWNNALFEGRRMLLGRSEVAVTVVRTGSQLRYLPNQ